MGQYHYLVNLDKKEFLHPHRCGAGLKLYELTSQPNGPMAMLGILLAASDGYGGGDFHGTKKGVSEWVGWWAGDRIAIVGDYAAATDLAPEHRADTIYDRCNEFEPEEEGEEDPYPFEGDRFTDISAEMRRVMNVLFGVGYRGTEDSWLYPYCAEDDLPDYIRREPVLLEPRDW